MRCQLLQTYWQDLTPLLSENAAVVSLLMLLSFFDFTFYEELEMWANAQPDGRPAEYR